MREITTSSGFVCEIDDAAGNDMELLDLFVDIDETEEPGEQMLIASKIARKLLGNEGRKKLYAHIRTPEGNVPIDRFMEIFQEIIQNLGDAKKKS